MSYAASCIGLPHHASSQFVPCSLKAVIRKICFRICSAATSRNNAECSSTTMGKNFPHTSLTWTLGQLQPRRGLSFQSKLRWTTHWPGLSMRIARKMSCQLCLKGASAQRALSQTRSILSPRVDTMSPTAESQTQTRSQELPRARRTLRVVPSAASVATIVLAVKRMRSEAHT